MLLLANENCPRGLVEALREDGHNVLWARETLPGTVDEGVLARARREGRILVTFDKDFGELAFRSRLPADSGVVLLRIPPLSEEYVVSKVKEALRTRGDWVGHFSVIEPHRIRMIKLPEVT